MNIVKMIHAIIRLPFSVCPLLVQVSVPLA
jgi:hypothetical protein